MPRSGCQFAALPWAIVVLIAVAGCAELNWLNPISRKQWAEDERILPSYYSHLKRIRAIESEAPRMDPMEQQRVANELSRLIREDENVTLRIAAVKSLAGFPAELSMPGVQFAAADANPDLRVAACEALGKVGNSAAVDILAALVEHDEQLDVRIAATRQLASFSDPQSLRALGIALDDTNPALQFRAMQSLKVASGRNYGDDIAMWRSWIRGEQPIEPSPSLADQLRRFSLF